MVVAVTQAVGLVSKPDRAALLQTMWTETVYEKLAGPRVGPYAIPNWIDLGQPTFWWTVASM